MYVHCYYYSHCPGTRYSAKLRGGAAMRDSWSCWPRQGPQLRNGSAPGALLGPRWVPGTTDARLLQISYNHSQT